jgi:hypothetical protein
MVKYIRWRYFGLPKANQSDLFGALLTAPEVQLVLGRLIKAQVKLQLFLQKFHNSKKRRFFWATWKDAQPDRRKCQTASF